MHNNRRKCELLNVLLFALVAISTRTATDTPLPATPLSAAAVRDAKCLTLALMGASAAKGDADKMKSAAAESWYFMGRLDGASSKQDLKPLLTRMAEEMQKDPAGLKALGSSCDALFVGRAVDLGKLVQ